MALELPKKFEVVRPWFERHRRDCWLPVVREGDGGATDSKFAGSAWLADGEPWPSCGQCGKPMWLFTQINLSTVPEPIKVRSGGGLLQAFFCVEDDCVHGPSEGDPFADTHLLRIVDPEARKGNAREELIESADGLEPIPVQAIVGWERVDDYPSMAEAEAMGLRHDSRKNLVICEDPKVEFTAKLEEMFELPWARDNEKLGGWPGWVNISTAYPDCPRCSTSMEFMIFQMGHSGHIPVMFGDGGQGHIVQCPKHRNILAYPWTCG